MTATERLYSGWLNARTQAGKANFESQLVAICIAACRAAHLTPPFIYEDRVVYRVRAVQRNPRLKPLHSLSDLKRSQGTDPNPFWLGRFMMLRPWVQNWVSQELEREKPLMDRARFIGRRCVLALIDEIRAYDRRRRGAQIRVHDQEDDPEEIAWLRAGMQKVLGEAAVIEKLALLKDRKLLRRFMAAYPTRLSNVKVALEWGVSEGAIRKRRKRIRQICSPLAAADYQLRMVLQRLGLAGGTKK